MEDLDTDLGLKYPRSPRSAFQTHIQRHCNAFSRLQMKMRGHVETLQEGQGFTLLSGWLAYQDGSPVKAPVSLHIGKTSFGKIVLERRDDLVAAGICRGAAAFRMVVPVQATADTVEVRMEDGAGETIVLPVLEPAKSPFKPFGHIDSVGPEGVIGWLVDPGLKASGQRPVLVVQDNQRLALTLSLERADINVQNWGGKRMYGFALPARELLNALRANSINLSDVADFSVALVSRGHTLAKQLISLSGGHTLIEPEPLDARTESHRVDVGGPESVKVGSRREGIPSQSNRPTMAVLSWDMGHNPVGRAYLLADVAAAHFEVKLIGPQFPQYGTGLWEPLREQTKLPVEIFPGGEFKQFLNDALRVAIGLKADVAYVSKPRLPSLLVGLLMKVLHGSALIIDIDDHELSFFKNDSPLGLDEAISLARLDPEAAKIPHSEIWTRLCETLIAYADSITVSNVALQKKFGGIIVRHARNEETFIVSPARRKAVRAEFGVAEAEVAVLFLGTPRPHKGIFAIADALERLNNKKLHLLIIGSFTDARTKKEFLKYKNAKISFFENQSWDRLPEIVAMADLVPVLQDSSSKISDFQIPAKLTDAIALGVPVIATSVPPLADLKEIGAFIEVKDQNIIKILEDRAQSSAKFDSVAEHARSIYLAEFTYAVNAHRIRLAAIEGQRRESPKKVDLIHGCLNKLYDFAGVPLSCAGSTLTKPAVLTGKRDVAFFWKQNDSDLYGRRPDMMVKYLLETENINKIIHFDRPVNITELSDLVDHGEYAKFHEGNLVYLNSVRRSLKMADSSRLFRRTFIHRPGSTAQSFLGKDLPGKEGYVDFVRDSLKEAGLDPHPIAWVCPVVFDFPVLSREIGFSHTVVDLVDDQRKWKAKEAYMKRVEQNYADVLALGDVVVSNCDPVKAGFSDLRDDIIVVPNGAEVFREDQGFEVPMDLAYLPRPIIGYVGNLRDRIDVKLIRKMASSHPEWSIVLIGSARGALDVIALSEVPNVYLLGVRPYAEVINYIRSFNVAIMPHVSNEISHNMNPLKLFVYFAARVPIVTSEVANIGDIGPYSAVATTHEEFIAAVESELLGQSRRIDATEREGVLSRVSWARRVREVLDCLGV